MNKSILLFTIVSGVLTLSACDREPTYNNADENVTVVPVDENKAVVDCGADNVRCDEEPVQQQQ
jgi:hypothetical protein